MSPLTAQDGAPRTAPPRPFKLWALGPDEVTLGEPEQPSYSFTTTENGSNVITE